MYKHYKINGKGHHTQPKYNQPYILTTPLLRGASGDTFRCMADVVIDDSNGYKLNVAQMSLLQIQDRPDVIFLKSDGA
jgi:hypothetical protein